MSVTDAKGILDVLPSTTSKYQYEGSNHCWRILTMEHNSLCNDQTGRRSEFVVFTNLDQETFAQDFDDNELAKSTDSYYPFLQILIAKMHSRAHEAAHVELAALMYIKLSAMNNAHLSLVGTGGATVETPSKTKEPDQSFRPYDLPHGHSDEWPSFVIETASSQAPAKLALDVHWWLTASNGDVKTALSIQVHQTKPELTIRKWELADRPTRTELQQVPVVKQEITIAKGSGGTGGGVHVRNGPLIIKFENLFLRAPTTAEEDIAFTNQDLELWGERVWRF